MNSIIVLFEPHFIDNGLNGGMAKDTCTVDRILD
jgi:hypothetical protein